MAEQKFDAVIVGGGPGGRTVARVLKKRQPELSVAVVKEHEINPNRCVIPYVFDDTVPVNQGLIPNTLVTEVGAELIIDAVESINPVAKRLELKSGGALAYDKLVLATGSEPVVPPIPGTDLAGVHVVREQDEMEALLATRARANSAVVIGLGLIGAEVAAGLKRAGLAVAGVDMLEHALGQPLDADYAELVDTELTSHGIELVLGQQVEAILGDAHGHVRAVSAGGRELPAELVVLAVGVRARSELAEAAGAECGPDGIVVDSAQRTTLPDVYAIGDCAETTCQVTRAKKPAMLGTMAVIQGKVAAKNILGLPAEFPGTLGSWACQVFDLPLGAVGVRRSEAEAAGIATVVGEATTLSRYPQMPGVTEVRARLVFAADDLRLLGGQVLGTFAVAGYLDLLALAIDKRLTAADLRRLQYATHPELAPRPSDNLVVMAAEAIHAGLQNA